MDESRWEQIQSLFHEALELSQTQQERFLRAACEADEALYGQVCAMLEEDRRGASILEENLGAVAGAVMEFDAPGAEAKDFGPYKVVRLLGEGGMGVVYLAQRKDLGGYVAIKVLRDSWLSPARRERFLSEQRTLAHLNYPSIAHLYDADVLSDGTPWFAMEYVEGIPINAWCREKDSTIARRLQLFRTVCDAVQYAHQQAVIHRDLKPSNILVKTDGSIRLLDFGIAKHLESLEMPANQTITGMRMMTPAYASPEQVRGEQASVQADVYSLGVILFELLTGELPFDLARLTPSEAATVLAEHDVPKPSMIVRKRRDAGGAASLLVSRREWADLDVLCLTSMHRDPQRRYRSVDALIRDVDHFTNREPLDVRRDSIYYRTGTFVRRHRGAVAAAFALILFIAALVTYSTLRIARARDSAIAEAARAERIQAFMMDLFDGGNEEAGPSDQLRVVALVDRGIQDAKALSATPRAQAELYQTLGSIEEKLGKIDKAEALLQSALSLRQKTFGTESVEAAETLRTLSKLRLDQARYEEAEQLARESIRIDAKLLPADHPALAKSISQLGMVLEDRGKYDEAIPVLQHAVDLQSGPGGVEIDLSSSLTELANSNFYAGHLDVADALDRRVIAIDQRLYGDHQPQIADDLINLGAVQYEWGRFAQAEVFDRQALDIVETFYGNDNPETASAMTLLGRTLVAEGKAADAVTMLQEALAIEERNYGRVHPRVATTLNDLGNAALQAGNLDEAKTDFERMAAICKEVYHGKHYYIGVALANLSMVYLEEKQFPKAEQLLRDSLLMYAQTLPPYHQNVAVARIRLGRVLLREGRAADAQGETEAGLQILNKQPTPSAKWMKDARTDLVLEQAALSQPGDAKAALPGQVARTADSVSSDH